MYTTHINIYTYIFTYTHTYIYTYYNNKRYELYIPLHQLWTQYMKELLGEVNTTNYGMIYSKFLKADFHGSIITGK